jgi:hypothetical protein
VNDPVTCREIFAFNNNGFWNRQGLHQSLGYLTPLEFDGGSVTRSRMLTNPGPAQPILFSFPGPYRSSGISITNPPMVSFILKSRFGLLG